MLDFMLARHCYDADDNEEECFAWIEADLLTCPCASCTRYRENKLAASIYERIYARLMEKAKADAKKPHYEGWVCP